MLLKSLTLQNIRIFKGVNTIDFTPVHSSKEQKPIILIGGKNGAGKTTMFESILLCLYGQNSLGGRLGKIKYEQFILQMTARNKKTEAPFIPAIDVVFEFSHAGTSHTYSVRREWNNLPDFLEILTVKRDGEILSDMEVDQWQDLLNELIPQRFARLFLFDGEKIQNLVEDNTDNLYLRDSFKSLLGLDIVERLKADLGIYLTRHLKSKEIKHFTQKLEELETAGKEIEGKKDHFLQDRAQIQSRYDQISSEIERQEQIVASEGGSFARKREELKNQKNHLDHQITAVEGDIRELCAGLFPFAITPQYCTQLKQHLIEEDTIQARKQAVIVDLETFNRMESIIEDNGLARFMEEAEEDDTLSVREAKKHYRSLKKA